MADVPSPTVPPAPADKAQFWTQTIAEFAASGLSVRAFCASRGLAEKRFFTWRRHLGLSPVAPPPAASAVPVRPFVPVRLVADPMAELVLPGGITLRVPLTADPTSPSRLPPPPNSPSPRRNWP